MRSSSSSSSSRQSYGRMRRTRGDGRMKRRRRTLRSGRRKSIVTAGVLSFSVPRDLPLARGRQTET
eukprot:8455599-Pyramimonas_sp.AAC.1